jgi:hypothetical protein
VQCAPSNNGMGGKLSAGNMEIIRVVSHRSEHHAKALVGQMMVFKCCLTCLTGPQMPSYDASLIFSNWSTVASESLDHGDKQDCLQEAYCGPRVKLISVEHRKSIRKTEVAMVLTDGYNVLSMLVSSIERNYPQPQLAVQGGGIYKYGRCC